MTESSAAPALQPLLPCPFCGGEPSYDNSDEASGGKWYACNDCGARQRVPYGTSEAELRARWNRRARSDSAAQRDAVLEEAATLVQNGADIFSCCQTNCRVADAIRALKKAAPQAQKQGNVESLETAGQPAESAQTTARCVGGLTRQEIIDNVELALETRAYSPTLLRNLRDMALRSIDAATPNRTLTKE